jgi:hypothetical protein
MRDKDGVINVPTHVQVARFRTLHLLVAALVLMARLLAPDMAFAASAPTDLATLLGAEICHADGTVPDKAPAAPGHHAHDCLLCPACHLSAQLAIPVATAVPIATGAVTLVNHAAMAPPTTGPPAQPRVADQPTGPPAVSI